MRGECSLWIHKTIIRLPAYSLRISYLCGDLGSHIPGHDINSVRGQRAVTNDDIIELRDACEVNEDADGRSTAVKKLKSIELMIHTRREQSKGGWRSHTNGRTR
jgi:hypothetical protein